VTKLLLYLIAPGAICLALAFIDLAVSQARARIGRGRNHLRTRMKDEG
jgi:hypothetical protein